MASISPRKGRLPQITPSPLRLQPSASQFQGTLPEIQAMPVKSGMHAHDRR
jgi:hypothetical protein